MKSRIKFEKNDEEDENEEDFFSFLKQLKKHLPQFEKNGDKSQNEIEIKTCQNNNPSNLKIDISTFDKLNFNKYFDINNSYIDNAIMIITFFFEVKNEKDLDEIENGLNIIISDNLKDIPTEKQNNFKFYLRIKGNNIFVDYVFLNEEYIKAFLNVGINFTEYGNFNFSFKSSFNINKLLTNCELKDFLYEAFSLIFYFKSTRVNIDYLFKCFKNVLNERKFKNEYFKDFMNKFMLIFNLSDALKFHLELYAKKIIDEILKIDEKDNSGNEFKKIKEKFKKNGYVVRKILKLKGLLSFAQIINIDNFSLYIGFPKYRNGISFNIFIKGLTKFVSILY